jgi:hypothetical protein
MLYRQTDDRLIIWLITQESVSVRTDMCSLNCSSENKVGILNGPYTFISRIINYVINK